MSPTRKPSAVTGLRKGLGTSTAPTDRNHGSDLPPVPLLPPRPEKPVRFTLDLGQADHQFLKQWAVHRGATASKVMRTLLAELRDDPELAIRVRAAISQDR
jgi:hypothetical protein